jgi:peptidoglycan/xylan/chitin deacetylase (PgdA/CDA1 family)
MLMSAEKFGAALLVAADRIEARGGTRPCKAFRPHAGWRGSEMFEGLRRIDHRLIGWGWMLWDWNWMRRRTADATFDRIESHASAGDIIVMHDGDESDPGRDQRHTVEATARLIPALRARGFNFGTVCENGA